jgi:hypothetical protein
VPARIQWSPGGKLFLVTGITFQIQGETWVTQLQCEEYTQPPLADGRWFGAPYANFAWSVDPLRHLLRINPNQGANGSGGSRAGGFGGGRIQQLEVWWGDGATEDQPADSVLSDPVGWLPGSLPDGTGNAALRHQYLTEGPWRVSLRVTADGIASAITSYAPVWT